MQRALLQEAVHQLDRPAVVEEAQLNVVQVAERLAQLVIRAGRHNARHNGAHAAAGHDAGQHGVLEQCLDNTLEGWQASMPREPEGSRQQTNG